MVRWSSTGIEYEADPRHVEMLLKTLSLENANSLNLPGVSNEFEPEDENVVGAQEAKLYRSLVARLNYLAADRPNIEFSVKELRKKMSAPSASDWGSLKRLGRYLAGQQRKVLRFQWQTRPADV